MGISYIICAAGLGTRLRSVAENIPKPLLRLQGKTLLRRSIESLPLRPSDQVIIIYRETSEEACRWKNEIEELKLPCSSKLVSICELTRGQLETALMGLPYVKPGYSVAIFNADTSFQCRAFLQDMESGAWEGLIPCIQAEGHSWSFCKVEGLTPPLNVLRVEEKNRISSWCSIGLYWFKNIEVFKAQAILEISEKNGDQELYVAPLYNRLIGLGLPIGMSLVEDFKPMGSLQQINDFWGVSKDDLCKEN